MTQELKPSSKYTRSFMERNTFVKVFLKVVGVLGVSLVMSGMIQCLGRLGYTEFHLKTVFSHLLNPSWAQYKGSVSLQISYKTQLRLTYCQARSGQGRYQQGYDCGNVLCNSSRSLSHPTLGNCKNWQRVCTYRHYLARLQFIVWPLCKLRSQMAALHH